MLIGSIIGKIKQNAFLDSCSWSFCVKFRIQVAHSLRAGSNSLRHTRHLRYTVLVSPNKDETAPHCCDSALSVLVMLVSRNVFYEVPVLQCLICVYNLFRSDTSDTFLISRSTVEPTLFKPWGKLFHKQGPLQQKLRFK